MLHLERKGDGPLFQQMIGIFFIALINELPLEEPTPQEELDDLIIPEFEMKQKIRIELKREIGWKEGVAACVCIAYALTWIIGSLIVKRKVRSFEKILTTSLRKYFAVVPDELFNSAPTIFSTYFTGRTNYHGVYFASKFKHCKELLMTIWDTIIGKGDEIEFQVIANPECALPAVFSYRKNRKMSSDETTLKMDQFEFEGMSEITDFGESRLPFEEAIHNFNQLHPNILKEIELTDTNRRQTCNEGRFLAYFKFSTKKPFTTYFNDAADFVVKVSDMFIKLRLTPDQYQHNIKARDDLVRPKK